MITLQMIKMISTFDGRNYVEWTRSFNYILQITWPFLRKIVSGLGRPEPISTESGEGEENASDIDDNDPNPSEVSAVGSIVTTFHSFGLFLFFSGRPGSSEVPRNPLTRWDVSSIPANGIFLTKKLKNKNKNAQRVEND